MNEYFVMVRVHLTEHLHNFDGQNPHYLYSLNPVGTGNSEYSG